MKWYKHDPTAFLDGASTLTLEETGAYIRIIDAIYARDGDLPDDDFLLVRVCNCEIRVFRRLKAALIRKNKIWIENNCIVAKRTQRTIEAAELVSEVQRKRIEKRWKNNDRPDTTQNPDKYNSFPEESQSAPFPPKAPSSWEDKPIWNQNPKLNGGSLATAPF